MIYCNGFCLQVGDPTFTPLDPPPDIRADIYGVIRCYHCYKQDNAGKVWPNHISGVRQLLAAEIKAGCHIGPLNYAGVTNWFHRSFKRMMVDTYRKEFARHVR